MELKRYLEERNLTNSEVCKEAEIAESTLSQFINGKRTINFKTACKICDAIGVSLDTFKDLTRNDNGEDK